MIYNPRQLANYLKLLRTRKHLTQAQVAKRVGIKQSTLSSFETNPETTRLQTFFKIIQALELNLEVHERKVAVEAQDDEVW
ncbi:type II toxin-antitoxin system antitoxin HipB [Photobacterium atrarenae]|uniref:Type II toxin-antitoxin system antitoxin HipB n=1 Tax=Photobacterium atrarenae TaxID=865757 RepID=A0ABY5GEH3_9GAMM|nr:type II toxin-antitoxin system antitoxin HipB [Photobacterium atrarenae]UTV27220.1 type II toxin-antitoxin system antitoxin HipB [Photobacterium atrarenae]